MKGAGNIAPFPFRCEPRLKLIIKERAEQNRRSVNAEINFLLETALNELAPTAVTVEAGKVQTPNPLETCDDKYND